ncbi:MFS domain-containing protein [Balamuthia mandrillaris]
MELITKRETSDRNEEDSPRTPNDQDSDEEESLAVKRKGLPEARDNPSNVQPTEPTLLATLLHRKVALSAELFSLWSVQRVEDGGLGFSTENIGTTAAIAGLIMAVFQMGVYPKMANRWGNLLMFQVSMVFIVPVIIAFPNLNYIPRHFPDKPWLLWVCLVSCVGLRYMSSVSSFTSLTILISNSAPTSKLGAVNGLGQSLGSLGRAVGPAVAGTTFAWSLSNGLGFPFDFRMDYIILAILSLICAFISILMPRTINVTFAEAEQEEAYQKRAR